MRILHKLFFLILILSMSIGCSTTGKSTRVRLKPAFHSNRPYYLSVDQLKEGTHHTKHAELFGRYSSGYNRYILKGIDRVQSTTVDGGGYFIGIKAVPTESPVGYDIKLFDKPLLDAPRTTSYCSGSTYAAFIEGLNLIFPNGQSRMRYDQYEAMRMQELDGGRREDQVKYWGHWNDDGYGSHYALVQYSKMGREILPRQARPGDFMNISWKKGGGHSVIFLGWIKNDDGRTGIAFWSSQKSTNGFGDVYTSSLDRISKVKTVRLTNPEGLFNFNIEEPVQRKIPGDPLDL